MNSPPQADTDTGGTNTTASIMRLVTLALLPALLVMFWFYGYGHLFHLLFSAGLALSLEHLVLWLRRLPRPQIALDGSALLTGALIGLSLPSLAPWWIAFIAVTAGMLLGKHLFGGLGYNIFNPAMVGYALVLVAFPLELSLWATPRQLDGAPFHFLESLQLWLGATPSDAFTGATPLEVVKFREGLTLNELKASTTAIGRFGGYASEWVNLAFLLGGLWLLWLKIFTWHAPIGLLAGLALTAILFYEGGGSASGGSAWFHLFSGATMMGAFFIVTDPVTGVSGARARLLMGFLVGVLIFCIRAFGGYPDAVAFAILIMNMLAPAIDLYYAKGGYLGSPPSQ